MNEVKALKKTSTPFAGKAPLTAEQKEAKRLLRAAKFRELGEARVSKAIRVLGHVANLGNRANYVYTDTQASKIIAALEDAMGSLRAAFQGGETASKLFTL